MQIIQSEENKKLNQEISILKEELSILVYEYELLKNTVCKNIEDKYFAMIGRHQLEKLYLEFETKKLKRKIELIQSYINQNKLVNIAEIENVLIAESQKWEREIKDYANSLKKAEKRMEILETQEDAAELKSLYRKLCKLLHSDINPNLSDEQKLLWSRVQSAYKNCNIEELEVIELILHNCEDFEIKEVEDDLFETKKRMKDSIKHYIEKINEVKNKEPYTLINIIENEELIEKEKEKIDAEKEKLEELILYYKNILNTLGYEGNVGFSYN